MPVAMVQYHPGLESGTREYWGKGHNLELKRLMVDPAFGIVGSVSFVAGESNHRSLRAVPKLGATEVGREPGAYGASVVHRIPREEWRRAQAP